MVSKSDFKSGSGFLRHSIKEVLKDGRVHLRKDIIAKITADYGLSNEEFTLGQWAGAFQSVVKEAAYVSPETGSYKYVGGSSNDSSTITKCKKILDEAYKQIQEEVKKSPVSTKTPLDLSQEEFAEVEQLRNLISKLKEVLV